MPASTTKAIQLGGTYCLISPSLISSCPTIKFSVFRKYTHLLALACKQQHWQDTLWFENS